MPAIPGYCIAIDLVSYLSVPSTQGFKYVLTIIDQATRFVRFIAIKTKNAARVAQKLLEEWVCCFGVPS